MSCAGFDVRDYFFGELPEAERFLAERHMAGCDACAGELEQLQGIRGTLMTLREEELPQRIGFVSDKVFEPSPMRRWLTGFWVSGARLGFASATMLSIALLVLAARQPKVIERRVEVSRASEQVDVKAVVAAAVKAAMAEQEKKTMALLAASDKQHEMQERDLALRVSDYTMNVEKRMAATRAMAMNYGGEGTQ